MEATTENFFNVFFRFCLILLVSTQVVCERLSVMRSLTGGGGCQKSQNGEGGILHYMADFETSDLISSEYPLAPQNYHRGLCAEDVCGDYHCIPKDTVSFAFASVFARFSVWMGPENDHQHAPEKINSRLQVPFARKFYPVLIEI